MAQVGNVSAPGPADNVVPLTGEDATIALVVDLDGTLATVDTLHESAMGLISRNPMRLLNMIGWLRHGKAGFKACLAAEALADASSLPLRDGVLDLIRQAKAAGRPVLLVSAADQRQVDAVAKHVGLFDEAAGSDGDRNLSGRDKADFLVSRFGERGFDYVGDSSVDLAVWRKARRAITVSASEATRRRVESFPVDVEHLIDRPSGLEKTRAHLRAMRPHQWLKNLLVFVPAVAAHSPGALLPSLVAFVAFCLAASSVYLLNDLLDIEADRNHPRKKLRPFAAGLIPVSHGLVHAAILIIAAFALALTTTPQFLAVLAGYLVLTFAYSLYLKRKLMIDIWILATLYTTRIIAGGAASEVPISEWLLALSMFIFLSLAAVKRLSELTDLVKRGATETAGRGYRTSDIPVILGVVLAAGYSSVLVLALYISNDKITALYARPELLWLICPLLLYWVSRVAMISYRGEMHDDPIVFAVKDKVSLAIFGLAGVLAVMGAVA